MANTEEKWVKVESENGKALRWKEEAKDDKQKENTVYIGEKVQGFYVERRGDLGANKSTMHMVKTEEHGLVGIWDSVVLADRFAEVPVGSEIKLNISSWRTSKAGKEYPDFEIQYRKPPMEVAGKKATDEIDVDALDFKS